jgi:calcium-dependent protein kinase
MDSNGDGMVSKTELYAAYKKLYNDKIKAHHIVDEIFHDMDSNNSGKVDFTGILQILL